LFGLEAAPIKGQLFFIFGTISFIKIIGANRCRYVLRGAKNVAGWMKNVTNGTENIAA